MPDRLFYTSDERDACVVQEVAAAHKCGQPVLIGSQSVEDSWRLSKLLEAESIPHQVLNAENDAKESEIIQLAGTLGAATISTNMAGRGTDIKLGNGDTAQYNKIAALGGLYVIGTQRHNSKRIDLQLRGRAGRQGEPGISRFFISCDDLLIKRFSSFDMSIFERTEQGEINTAPALKQLDKIQRVAEGHNLEVKTRLYKYEEVIYLQKRVFNVYRENLAHSDLQPLLEHFEETCPKHDQTLKDILPSDQVAILTKKLFLNRLDKLWTDYFCESRKVVQGIQYRILGGENTIMEYKKWALTTFEQVIKEFESGMASCAVKIWARDFSGICLRALPFGL